MSLHACEFVGGSQDGAVMEIHPAMNYRLRFPMTIPLVQELSLEPKNRCEEYEYMSDGKYHFIGYA